jgi:hypothetical protein
MERPMTSMGDQSTIHPAERRDVAVDKYFRPTPVEPQPDPRIRLLLTVGGVLLGILAILLLARAAGVHMSVIPLPLTGIAGLSVLAFALQRRSEYRYQYERYQQELARSEPKPSDAQMQAWLNEGLQFARARARELLDIGGDAEGDPVVLYGPQPADTAAVKIGRDGVVRYKNYRVLVAVLTARRVSIYECDLDVHDSNLSSEGTAEYHHQDIDGLEVVTDRRGARVLREPPIGAGLAYDQYQAVYIRMEIVRIVVSGRVAVNLTAIAGSTGQNSLSSTIGILRSHLREHKGGNVAP